MLEGVEYEQAEGMGLGRITQGDFNGMMFLALMLECKFSSVTLAILLYMYYILHSIKYQHIALGIFCD